MAGRIEARLQELGITLPAPAAPVANYIPYNVSGKLVVVSGQIPLRDGKIAFTGKVGAGVARYAPRAIRRVHITAFGQDVACTHLEYERTDTGLIGRETKIMARIPDAGWRVVSAHVSLLAAGDPGRAMKG